MGGSRTEDQRGSKTAWNWETRSDVAERASNARDWARYTKHNALSGVVAGDDDENQDAADCRRRGDRVA